MNQIMSRKKQSYFSSVIISILLIGAVSVVYFFFERDIDGRLFERFGPETQAPTTHQQVVLVDDQHQQFIHPRYGFSVVVPKDLDIIRVDEGEGTETIVFTPKAEDSAAVMQIFVTPYLPSEITEERLRKDVPGGEIKDINEVLIGAGSDIRAVRFSSQHPGLGEAREVWFIRNGYLFEVMTRMENDAWLATVLKTWQFAD